MDVRENFSASFVLTFIFSLRPLVLHEKELSEDTFCRGFPDGFGDEVLESEVEFLFGFKIVFANLASVRNLTFEPSVSILATERFCESYFRLALTLVRSDPRFPFTVAAMMVL